MCIAAPAISHVTEIYWYGMTILGWSSLYENMRVATWWQSMTLAPVARWGGQGRNLPLVNEKIIKNFQFNNGIVFVNIAKVSL